MNVLNGIALSLAIASFVVSICNLIRTVRKYGKGK